jgi:hypothetical protein
MDLKLKQSGKRTLIKKNKNRIPYTIFFFFFKLVKYIKNAKGAQPYTKLIS